MPELEVVLPDRVDSEIQRLVDQGEFLNRERAVEELLTLGKSAYETTEESTAETGRNPFSQVADEQQDPAMRDDPDADQRTF